jgi:hypothetical protein
MAKPEITKLFRTAFEITGHNIFSHKLTNTFINEDVFNFEYQNYISYCNKISLAVWYNSLKREGYVK